MSTSSRDQDLCQDYQDGMEISEVARAYGVSTRRVSQILLANGVPRRPRSAGTQRALSQLHVRVGLHLHHYRHQNEIPLGVAADALGWNVIKIRKVENGVTEVELLDLLDIAAYTGVKIGDMMEKINGN